MSVAEIEKLSKSELVSLVIDIKQQLDWYQKQIFGQKSERQIYTSGNQLSLGELSKEANTSPPPAKQTVTYERKKRQKGKLPGVVDEHGLSFDSTTPVKIIEIPDPEIAGLVEGQDYEVVSTKSSSTLAQKPGSYFVLRYQQKVVKLKATGELTTATIKPQGVLEGSYADVSLLANLLIDKFIYHLPLYRQHQRIAASGVKVARSSLTNFVHGAISLLEPVYLSQKCSIRESELVAMDETPIKAGHNKGKRKLNSGYFWGVFGDRKEIDFHFAPSRASPVISEVLGEDFAGILLTDGYEPYARYSAGCQQVVHAECWSHTRRAFLKAQGSHPALVACALEYIREIYQIESEIKELDSTKKLQARGQRSRVIVEQFFEWLNSSFKTHCLLPNDEFTKAANYALSRQDRLRVFLDIPELQPDTNHLEREIRTIAVGRKNWLFCWTEVGAKYAGIIYSLLATCKLHGVNPYHYLVDVLQRVSVTSQADVALLTPRLWKDHFQDQRMISAVDIE
jgi:transposase